MVGTGGSALVAKTLGEGKDEKANRYFTMMVKLTLLLGIVLSIIGCAFIRPVSFLLGATDAMINDCVVYGRTLLLFTTAFMLQNVFQAFLTTAGKPRLGFVVTVIAGIVNILLDALFIVVFKWGVLGAAVATGIGQCVGGVLPLIYFIRPNSSSLHLTRTKMERRAIQKACVNGSSEFVSNISSSLISVLFNLQLLKFAGENGVAAYGTLMYVQFIFIAIFIGYTIGTSPIIGYHYGAAHYGELKSLLKKGLFTVGVAGIVMMCVALLFAGTLANVFVGYDAELFEMTTHAFKLFSFSFVLSGINIFASSFFTALNNGGVSAAISFLRTLVFQVICVLVLPVFWGLDGIWLSIVIAEVLAFCISLVFLIVNRKKYHYS
uniref:MATE family efflux transporter n=1 Tax=uncultured Spirochaetaceae bacterium TaxID=201186 RepID=A0A650F5E4_9SPIO|nr:MATE family efflux transporter [uncultured Spirochaetaceae bacterium]